MPAGAGKAETPTVRQYCLQQQIKRSTGWTEAAAAAAASSRAAAAAVAKSAEPDCAAVGLAHPSAPGPCTTHPALQYCAWKAGLPWLPRERLRGVVEYMAVTGGRVAGGGHRFGDSSALRLPTIAPEIVSSEPNAAANCGGAARETSSPAGAPISANPLLLV